MSRAGTEAPAGRAATAAPDNAGGTGGQSSRLTFDGTGDYQAFKTGMKQTLRTMTSKSRQERAIYLFQSLRGDAITSVMAGMPDDDDDDEDIGRFAFAAAVDIWRQLDARYAVAGTMSRVDAISELMYLKQGNKSIDEYTGQFNATAPYTGWDVITQIGAYMAGMKPELRGIIGIQQPDRWPEAVRAARKAESIAKYSRPSRNNGGNGGRGRGRGASHAPARGTGEQRDITCYNCGETGHMARECTKTGTVARRGGGSTRGRGGRAPGRESRVQELDDSDYDLSVAGNE